MIVTRYLGIGSCIECFFGLGVAHRIMDERKQERVGERIVSIDHGGSQNPKNVSVSWSTFAMIPYVNIVHPMS